VNSKGRFLELLISEAIKTNGLFNLTDQGVTLSDGDALCMRSN
jgi:hypothetical protein